MSAPSPGIVASRLLDRTWEDGPRQRAARLYFVYAVWAVVTPLAVSLGTFTPLPDPLGIVATIFSGSSEAWYLWALAACLFVAWSTRRAPWWAAIGLALLVAFASPWVRDRT